MAKTAEENKNAAVLKCTKRQKENSKNGATRKWSKGSKKIKMQPSESGQNGQK